jgi:signal peptidase I
MAAAPRLTKRPSSRSSRPSRERIPADRTTVSQSAWDWLRTLAGAFAIYFVVQAFLVQAFRIPSGSMEDTLLVGDWLFVNKAIYGPKIPFTDVHLPSLREPQRGSIVVYESPIEPGLNLVKRVIGVGGDTLAMRGAQLIRNGEEVEEPYVHHRDPGGNTSDPAMRWQFRHLAGGVDPRTYRPMRDDWGPVVVPAGHFFMMGDNRDASFDSRYYGFVRRELLRGQPLFIYYSYDARSPKPLPFLTAIRWERIGDLIR